MSTLSEKNYKTITIQLQTIKELETISQLNQKQFHSVNSAFYFGN